jgi:hypothetical protein
MEDKLKQFVQGNREEFDSFEPRPDLWQDISRQLDEQKSTRVIPFFQRPVWRYAASILLLIGIGYGLVQYGKSLSFDKTGSISQTKDIPLNQIAPEMAEVETYYMSVIHEKQQERNAYDLQKLGLAKDFAGELAQLDSAYVQLKKQLVSNPNKQMVIDAMVRNLQIRIGILNQQLEVLNQIQEVKTPQKDEKRSI